MGSLVCLNYLFFCFRCYRVGVDVIDIEIIAYEEVLVACGGWYGEMASLVGANGAGDRFAGCIDVWCVRWLEVGKGAGGLVMHLFPGQAE